MPLKMKYRVQTFLNAGDNLGDNLANVGYDPTGIVTGLNQFADLSFSDAKNLASQQNAFYEKLGIDVRTTVFGKPQEVTASPYSETGTAAPGSPVRSLNGTETAEREYIHLDTVPKSLREAIGLANRSASGSVSITDETPNPDANTP